MARDEQPPYRDFIITPFALDACYGFWLSVLFSFAVVCPKRL
jgi:hypothetical protein